MHITSTSQSKGFSPFSIAIGVETVADAARLMAIFSDPAVSAVLAGADEDVALDAQLRSILRASVSSVECLVGEPAYQSALSILRSEAR